MRLYICRHRIRILLFRPLMSATCCLATAFLHNLFYYQTETHSAFIVTLCLRANKRTVYLDMHTLVLKDYTPGYLCLLLPVAPLSSVYSVYVRDALSAPADL